MKSLLSGSSPFRNSSELPLFCKPIPLFLIQWSMMLFVLALHVTVYTYPDAWMGVRLFLLSFASLSTGYLLVRFAANYRVAWPVTSLSYRVNLTVLRRVYMAVGLVALLIVVMNFIAYGPPPLLVMFGATTLNYVEYGKLKQVLNAAILACAVLAILEPSTWRKSLIYAFSFLCMLAYATRGFLLVMLAQVLFSYCLTTRISKRMLYVITGATLLAAVLLSNFVGNGRAASTSDAFVAFFGIETRYAAWPMATLWILSYVSTPISNICWIVHTYPYDRPSLVFLSSLLPAFWSPEALEVRYLGPNIVDGVSTYLVKYYLDLWLYGIVLINGVWGVIMGVMTYRGRLTRKMLTSSVLLGAIGFLFYADFISFLSILMELGVLLWVERTALLPLPPAEEKPNQQAPA